jgi:paraquat-inducible protein B
MTHLADAPVPPRATTKRSRRLPIIWIIPIAAIAIGAWLAYDTYSKRGPTITISFDTAEGLQPGQSQLKFKDIVFGTVQGVALTPDNRRVTVTVATTRQAEPLLTDTTVFWVVKPRLFAGNISGLDTLLSGSYIGMLPAAKAGQPATSFVGRQDPPVLEADVPGHTFLLKAKKLGSISLGSPVFFRDLTVGEVLGWDIADMAEYVTIRAFVRAPYDSYVHDESRFWNASGISVNLGATGVEVQMESLRALLLGGIAFDTPAESGAPEASLEKHVFPLFDNREAAVNASYRRKVTAVAYFPGSVRGLAPGSEVTMHGLVVGHVLDVRLAYSREKNAVVAPVRFEIEPERILGVGAKAIFKSPAEAAAVMLKRGLHASLESASLITGGQMVALEFVSSEPTDTVTMEGNDVVLPTTEGGGFASLTASATTLLDKVNTIPFTEIGDNLNGILRNTNELVGGPQVKQALADLSTTLKSAKDLMVNVNSGINPTLRQLPAMVAQLDKALVSINKLALSLDDGYGGNTQFNRDLDRLLVQANDAVRSIRSLADLLSRHPEALIKGRPTGEIE